MSVINKMLRDLDQRQTPAAGAADLLRRDTASVAALPRVRRRSPALRWATALLPLVAVLAGGFVWWSFQALPAPAPVVPAPPTQAPALAPVPVADPVAAAAQPQASVASAPVSMPVAALPAHAAPAALPASVGLRMDSTLSSPSSAAPVPQATPVVVPAPPAAKVAVATASAVPPVSVASVVAQAPAKPSPPVAEAVPAGARQQQAGREALAQAQALWASGARDSAISTLQEAVATAERAPSAATTGTLVPMVRELARMELAEGRPAAVWDLLTRLEPLLANQPELWALRANAAQRLGRHQESVQAYTTALQSRPGEQRWLLGAAVSLAALGQTGAAAEMADKARAVGPVSREVLAYLRQQGVPLTDRP
jgi:MSHA biogenesis protein MshN